MASKKRSPLGAGVIAKALRKPRFRKPPVAVPPQDAMEPDADDSMPMSNKKNC